MGGFLNLRRNSDKDVGAEFIGEADIPSGPNFTAHYSALPFDSSPANLIDRDISTVDPLAGIQSPAQPMIPTQDVWNDLAALYAKMPNVEIQLFPQAIRTAFLLTANVAIDLTIPTGAAIVKFFGPGDFYVSIGGRAVVPILGGDVETASLYKPTGLFYCGGAKQVSVVSATANSVVQAAFWSK